MPEYLNATGEDRAKAWEISKMFLQSGTAEQRCPMPREWRLYEILLPSTSYLRWTMPSTHLSHVSLKTSIRARQGKIENLQS